MPRELCRSNSEGIQMKLDMGQAWNAATELLGKNKDVVLIVAGMFIFLPTLALNFLMPGLDQPPANPEDMDAVFAALVETYQQYWWAFAAAALFQAVGTLALLTLLTDASRPTVAEALKQGARGVFPYLGAQILLGLGAGLVIGLPVGLAVASGNTVLVTIMSLVAIAAIIYMVIKTVLISAVIAIEKIYNPITIIKRSWTLTAGNSLRLLGFFALIMIAMGILFMVINGILTVVLAAIGGQMQVIGTAIVSGLLNTVFAVVTLAVLAGVHRQLSGATIEDESDTFA